MHQIIISFPKVLAQKNRTATLSGGFQICCLNNKNPQSLRNGGNLVPVAGLEPARYRYRWILSPLRLPIPSHRQIGGEMGIRTPDTAETVYMISNHAPSASSDISPFARQCFIIIACRTKFVKCYL